MATEVRHRDGDCFTRTRPTEVNAVRSTDRRTGRSTDGRLVALLILAAVLLGAWFLADRRHGASDRGPAGGAAGTREDSAADRTRRAAAAARDARVVGFLAWVQNASARTDPVRASEHAAEGIRRMAGAITVLAVRDSAGRLSEGGRITALDSLADRIVREPRAVRQAVLTRDAFVASAVLLQEMHRRRFPNAKNEVVEARLAANLIRGSSPLKGQERAIDQFFERAAVAVRKMSLAP